MRIQRNDVYVLAVDYGAVKRGEYHGTPAEEDAIAEAVVDYLMDAVPSTVFRRIAEMMAFEDAKYEALRVRAK